MRVAITTAFIALALASGSLGASQDKPMAPGSINRADVKAGYKQIVTRYAAYAERKKEQASAKKTAALFEQSFSVDPAKPVAPPPAPAKKRGMTLPLTPVGGYPKMLGQTFNAAVGLGTPAQMVNLTADTGSMLTWAIQNTCSEADCPGVTKKKTYDPTKSKTSKKLRGDHEAYGDGEMDLMLYNDVVRLETTVVNVATIGAASHTFAKDGSLDHDGLLGLGRKADAAVKPVLESLSQQDEGYMSMIAFDLGADANVEIGGYDYEKYPKLVQIKVDDDDGWLLSKSSVTAEQAPPVEPVDLLVDTGSSVSMLPASRMDAIMNRPGLMVKRTTTEPIVYSMPCDTKLQVQIVLPDGTKVPVKDSDILMQSNDPTMPGCLSLLVGTTNPFLPSVAGTPMLKSIYTVLAKSTEGDWIGLAPLLESGAGTVTVAPQVQPHHRRRRHHEASQELPGSPNTFR